MEETTTITVRIPVSLKGRLDANARKSGYDRSNYVRALLEDDVHVQKAIPGSEPEPEPEVPVKRFEGFGSTYAGSLTDCKAFLKEKIGPNGKHPRLRDEDGDVIKKDSFDDNGQAVGVYYYGRLRGEIIRESKRTYVAELLESFSTGQ